MNITFVPSHSTPFSSSRRIVFESANNDKKNTNPFDEDRRSLLYSNYTYFFREDLSSRVLLHTASDDRTWKHFRKVIARQFKDAPKVNVYDFASSDGSEAYSFAVSMIEELGEENAQKFFPIQAYDIDSEIIAEAQKNKIPCNSEDLVSIGTNTGNKRGKYFDIRAYEYSGNKFYDFELNPKPVIEGVVNFEQADIKDKIDEIEPDNTLILCRNVWPYLENGEDTLQKLIDRINSGSIIVFGGFDTSFLKEENCSSIISQNLNRIEKYIYEKKISYISYECAIPHNNNGYTCKRKPKVNIFDILKKCI